MKRIVDLDIEVSSRLKEKFNEVVVEEIKKKLLDYYSRIEKECQDPILGDVFIFEHNYVIYEFGVIDIGVTAENEMILKVRLKDMA